MVLAVLCALAWSVSVFATPQQAHAEQEPQQTYEIRSAAELKTYSVEYAKGNRNPRDVLDLSSMSSGSVLSDVGYISLGTESRPFAGTLIISSVGVNVFHLFNCPLFDYVSTDLVLKNALGAATSVQIMREAEPETPDVGTLTKGALFANHVVKGTNSASWMVTLVAYSGDGDSATDFAGVLGDIADECTVSLTFDNTADLSVVGAGPTGLICGTLGADASLTVTTAGSGGNIAVTSTGGNAGGIVGTMMAGSALQLASANLSRVTSVTAAGFAGGIVGSVTEADVTLGAGGSDYTVSGSVTGTTGSGGLFGFFGKTGPVSFDMADYQITSGMTIDGAGHSGGVVGMLDNRGGVFDFDGNYPSETITVTVSGGSTRGGLIGSYKAGALTDTLIIHDASTAVTASGTAGGLVGATVTNPAYVNIHDVRVVSSGLYGGLIGSLRDVGSFADVSGSVIVSGTSGSAGLIGSMSDGVLRIAGTTDLGGLTRTDGESGAIVKDRDRALIYALGDGKGTNGNWTFKRNTTYGIDDVHSWGEVLRTDGVILAESDLFTVDGTAHTVTLKGAYTTMNTVTQFALTALNIQLNNKTAVGALRFTSGSANQSTTLLAGSLTLGADITLAGTGLTGLTRDNGGNAAFSGTFSGGGHTLTLATGEPYGLTSAGAALPQNTTQGNICRHTHTGLFAETASATISNLTLAGAVNIYQTVTGLLAGGLVGEATVGLTLDHVTVDFTLNYRTANDYAIAFGGAAGTARGAALAVSVSDCVVSPTVIDATSSGIARGDGNDAYFGGLIGTSLVGMTASPTQTITIEDTVFDFNYSKPNNTNRESCFGAVIAYLGNSTYVKGRRTVTLEDVDITISATGVSKGGRFGCILGVEWLGADVSITGLTVTSATLTATGDRGDFGGLVQVATGHWDIQSITLTAATFTLPNSNSTFGFVTNKAYSNAATNSVTSGKTTTIYYDKTALYLDVVYDDYDIGALTFAGGTAFAKYDELVACSLAGDNTDVTVKGNAVVSITTSGNNIDTSHSTYNTYLNKTTYGKTNTKEVNDKTRYYYDLAYARSQVESYPTGKYAFLVWSVDEYAHSSLSDWFTTGNTFTGDLDMTGMSYYPVDLSGSLTINSATLKLDNVLMEAAVYYAYDLQASGSRTTRSNTNQHYLMHTALLRNITGTLNMTTVVLQGNVPRLSGAYCGMLVASTAGGADNTRARLNLNYLTLDGVYISDGDNHLIAPDTSYAPLTINKIGKGTELTWKGVGQTGYSSFAGSSYYAGSSLIGDVGDSGARAIYLTFTEMVLDGRSTASAIDNLNACYGTTKSIFSRATILNSWMYSGESAGSYNFRDTEDRTGALTATHSVTYGKEITDSAENPDGQKKYYGSEYYVDPANYQSTSESYTFSSGWLPYVYVAYNLSEHKHELFVNVTYSSVIEGCGQYGDPYVVDDNDKLSIISNIIAGVDVGDQVKFYLPADISGFDYTLSSITSHLYTFNATTMRSTDGGSDVAAADVRRYMAGAYIVVSRDITLSKNYKSLGEVSSAEYAFRGVIIGLDNPTITNNSPNPLIHTSTGCVVKDVTVNVDVNVDSSDVIELSAPTGSDTYDYAGGIQSYGAVIGQILGGDTFIDNVQVTFSAATFSYKDSYDDGLTHYNTLTPVGGYVGTLLNGGLIFRNMTSANVGLTSVVFDKVENSGYLYVNPIIGRVIAGYAFYEASEYHPNETDCTLKNGLKNYTIADLCPSLGKLNVTNSSSTYTITVPNGQALFVLSAIVNSGAASAEHSTSDVNAYQTFDGTAAFWSAYRAHTTARAGADYDDVGQADFDESDDFTDYAVHDLYSADSAKIPYIVRAYTAMSGSVYLARCVSGRTNSKVTVTGDCVVPAGFRGIGNIYYESSYLRLGISQMTGKKGDTQSSYQIKLNMRYLEYNHYYVSQYIATTSSPNNTDNLLYSNSTAGFGLFNRLDISSASATNSVQYLELAGSIFYDVYTIAGAQANYNFGAFKDNDRSEKKDVNTTYDNDNVTMRRTILSVGGVAGFVGTKCYIKNVTFNDFSVEGAKYAGGLIGLISTRQNTLAQMSIVAYESGITNAGYVNVVGGQVAGGLIGKIYVAPVQILGATGGTDIIVKTIESKDSDPNEFHLVYFANLNTGVGGLVGNCWGSDKSGYASPASITASFSNKAQNELIINNINVVKGESTATVRVRNDRSGDTDDRYNGAGGFVGSAHYVYLKINDSNLKCVNVQANAAGGFIGKLTQHYYLEIFNCSANGCATDGSSKDATIEGTRHAGGAVGWAVGRDKLYFQLRDFVVKNYTIESYTRKNSVIAAAGGVVGYAEGNNVAVDSAQNVICQYNNLTVLNCDIKTNYTNRTNNYLKYKCGTGGIIGVIDSMNNSDGKGDPKESGRVESYSSTNNKYKFSGYNILVKDCTFTHLNGGSSNDSTSATNRRIGDIVGNNAVSTTLKFVGVSVQNATYCGKHVGYYNSDSDNYGSDGTFGTGYLVLANYAGVTDNHTFAGIDDTGVNTDDYTDVTVAYPYVTANPSITFGGLTLTGDAVAASVASLPIQSIKSDYTTYGALAGYAYGASAYYTGSSGNSNYQSFTAFGNKFVMFKSEVPEYLGTDFPVLLVDDTNRANTHRLINSYIRLLTNTVHDFGVDSAGVYSVNIYRIAYDNGVFTPTTTSVSLRRADGLFYMSSTLFDSGKTQFTLIDVRFYNPVNAEVAYHLYVPVFVKKVLNYQFDVAVHSGTTYLDSLYAAQYGQALIENVGTPVTAYFKYTYLRTAAEWMDAINGGEDVNRNFTKNLMLYKANTSNLLDLFPADTVLVLVDPNRGGKPYYATVGTAVVGNTLSLAAFRSVMSYDGSSYSFSGDYFAPLHLDELLGLTVTRVGDGSDTMVPCAAGVATAMVGQQGYRIATDEEMADGSVLKYTLTTSASNMAEAYYLSIFTESNAINDQLFHYYLITTASSFNDGDHPSKISDTGAHTMVHLVMGKIFLHDDLAVNSFSKRGPDIMTEDNNELNVTFSTDLGIAIEDEEIKSNMRSLIRSANVYHSFLVYLNRNDGSEVTKAIIGNPTGSGHYLLDGIAGAVQTDYLSSSIRVTQNYAEFVSENLNEAFASGNDFTIRATVTLAYDSAALLSQFPGRGLTTPDNGVQVSGSSNLAFSVTATTYSKNMIAEDDGEDVIYYSEAEPEVANLDLNPVGDKLGDFTPLGINSLNNDNATRVDFDLLAVLDITSVAEVVANYDRIAISATLAVKNSSGEYENVTDISQYLTMSIVDVPAVNIVTSGATVSTSIGSDHTGVQDNGADITLPLLHFSVVTGSALEAAGLRYANYRITVRVGLRDEEGADYAPSYANNYVIYTNAKVIPDYID